MSWLTVWLRGNGFGGVLDQIEGVEKAPSPTNVSAAVSAVIAAAPTAANTAIGDLGMMAGQIVIGAATKINPGVGTVTASIVGPLLAEVETVAEKWLAGITGGAL